LRLRVQFAAVLIALFADLKAEPATSVACQTVSSCLARAREVADPDTGITPDEDEVARRLESLSPQSISPVLELLDDPNKAVRELAGYILRDMPGLEPRHLERLQRAVEAGDGWLPPAIASIGTPDAIEFLVKELRKNPETHTQLTYAFRRLGPAAFPEILELFRCGTSCDEKLLRVAGFILSEVRDRAAEVVVPLETIATDRGASLVERRWALRALAGLGATARPAVEVLLEMTKTQQESTELQAEAREAVLAIGGPGTKAVLESSLDAAEDKPIALRDIAVLGEAGREAGPGTGTHPYDRLPKPRFSLWRGSTATPLRPNAATSRRTSSRTSMRRESILLAPTNGATLPCRRIPTRSIRQASRRWRSGSPTTARSVLSVWTGLVLPVAARFPPSDCVWMADGSWARTKVNGGGELVFKSDASATAMVLERNISALHVLSDGRMVAVTGLAHLTIDEGDLYTVSCTPVKECTARWWKTLPAAPRSSWLLETGELLINTNGGSVLVDRDGGLSLADCHAENSRR
jgi:HEAT repeat protein